MPCGAQMTHAGLLPHDQVSPDAHKLRSVVNTRTATHWTGAEGWCSYCPLLKRMQFTCTTLGIVL